MKEELVKFKELIKEYNRLFDTFSNKRALFNLKVEDLCEDYGYSLHPMGLGEEQLKKLDYYARAKHFFNKNMNVIREIDTIRKGNLDADKRKLNLLYIRHLNRNLGFDYETSYFYAMNYSIYESAGFYKTLSCETSCENNLRRVSNQATILKQNGFNCVDDMLKGVKGKLKPYTLEAKNGLNKVKRAAKPIIHEGSKTLAKVFTKIADMTQKKKN